MLCFAAPELKAMWSLRLLTFNSFHFIPVILAFPCTSKLIKKSAVSTYHHLLKRKLKTTQVMGENNFSARKKQFLKSVTQSAICRQVQVCVFWNTFGVNSFCRACISLKNNCWLVTKYSVARQCTCTLEIINHFKLRDIWHRRELTANLSSRQFRQSRRCFPWPKNIS